MVLLLLRQIILLQFILSSTRNKFDLLSFSSSSSSSSSIVAVEAITNGNSRPSVTSSMTYATPTTPTTTESVVESKGNHDDNEDKHNNDDDIDENVNENTTLLQAARTKTRTRIFNEMYQKISKGKGFIAALDQSGGSTPKALQAYGMNPSTDNYEDGTDSMYDAVHKMRTRIITNPSFNGDKVIGAILFENTMNRQIDGLPTCQYLWERKGIVPFLKIDRGLLPFDKSNNDSSVQFMNYIPKSELTNVLKKAITDTNGVLFGTKARSVIINGKYPTQIQQLVQQQFAVARLVLQEGLVPILEPEIDIHAPDKELCEELLCAALLVELDKLHSLGAVKEEKYFKASGVYKKWNKQVMIKLSLPRKGNQYSDVMNHPCCLRVIVLSGGYKQKEACDKLSTINFSNIYKMWDGDDDKSNSGRRSTSNSNIMIASFSRAFVEGLQHAMSNDEFTVCLSKSIDVIYCASTCTTQTDQSD